MGAPDTPQMNDAALAFVQRWQNTTASELSTAQSFVRELCDLLGVENPHATTEQHYMFERPITFHHGDGSTSAGRIDCYRRGAFVLEAKKLKVGAQTKGFDDALMRARAQAESYARALPAATLTGQTVPGCPIRAQPMVGNRGRLRQLPALAASPF